MLSLLLEKKEHTLQIRMRVNAGFAAAVTEGQNIKDAIAFASATAGLSTTKIGTANSMPNREEIDKILQLV